MLINGWTVIEHPKFLDQVDKLTAKVEALKAKDPKTYEQHSSSKLLIAINKLAYKVIPEDPTRPEYRLGDTLGAARKHWFRAKFGNGRFRLFFRFDSRAKIIMIVWVNDETTLRTYGSKTDAYAVFRKMLDNDDPPDNWDDLMAAARHPEVLARLESRKPPDLPE